MLSLRNQVVTAPITELDVQALVDSQLSWEEEKEVLREMERNPALKAYHRQIIAQKKLLIAWWQNQEFN